MNKPTFQNLSQVSECLKRLASTTPGGGVAFDADGTLWRHDVGVVAFNYFCAHELILEEVGPRLISLAREFSVELPAEDSPSKWALALDDAYQRGVIGEKTICEMQVWIYAGYSQAELAPRFRRALELSNHRAEIFPEMLALIEHCRSLELKPFVVSASPVPVLDVILTPHLFAPEDIAGGRLEESQSIYQSVLSVPLPYGAQKAEAGKRILQSRSWLMALGDSAFDLDMMTASQQGVAIGRKPHLEKALKQLDRPDEILRIEAPLTAGELGVA